MVGDEEEPRSISERGSREGITRATAQNVESLRTGVLAECSPFRLNPGVYDENFL